VRGGDFFSAVVHEPQDRGAQLAAGHGSPADPRHLRFAEPAHRFGRHPSAEQAPELGHHVLVVDHLTRRDFRQGSLEVTEKPPRYVTVAGAGLDGQVVVRR
jgi:hypothetical protein